jgi:hypothetical protein
VILIKQSNNNSNKIGIDKYLFKKKELINSFCKLDKLFILKKIYLKSMTTH